MRRILFAGRCHCRLSRRAGRETVIDNHNSPAGQVRGRRWMESRLITSQALGFLRHHPVKLRAIHVSLAHGSLVEYDNTRFGERANREFAMPGMANLANDQNIQGLAETIGYPCANHHAAARQSDDNIGLHPALQQISAKLLACIFPR